MEPDPAVQAELDRRAAEREAALAAAEANMHAAAEALRVAEAAYVAALDASSDANEAAWLYGYDCRQIQVV